LSGRHQTRLYLEADLEGHLAAGRAVTLSRSASHHVTKVLRLPSGAEIILFNGDGNDYRAALSCSGKLTTATLLDSKPGLPESPLALELIQGISRGDRMETSLQKAVELGVHRIQPVFTEKSTVRLQGERLDKKHQHWVGVITSACEQSGRSVIPQLAPALPLRQYLQAIPDTGSHWFCLPGSQDSIGAISLTDEPCRLLIGPESGLSEDEIQWCRDAGFNPLSLGQRILRTETAGPAAIAILQSRFGDLR